MLGPFAHLGSALSASVGGVNLLLPTLAASDHGLLYLVAAPSDDSLTIAIYADQAQSALVAEGSGALGTLAIGAANGSGILGSIEALSLDAAEGWVFVGLAASDDLRALHRNIDALLDDDGQVAGSLGFRAFLDPAANLVLRLIASRLEGECVRVDLPTAIGNREVLKRAAALFALGFLHDWLGDENSRAEAEAWHEAGLQELLRQSLTISNDGQSFFTLEMNRHVTRRG